MAGPIDVIQRALSALASAGLGSESPAEAYVLGYQPAGGKRSTCAYESKRQSTTKRRKRMSIISSEIEAQKQRDPSYIDSDLQWAWGRGYKAGASREITEEEIAAAMAETRSHHAPRRVVGEHHQNRVRRGKKKGNGGVSRPRAVNANQHGFARSSRKRVPSLSPSARGAACTSSRIGKPCGSRGITGVWRVTT